MFRKLESSYYARVLAAKCVGSKTDEVRFVYYVKYTIGYNCEREEILEMIDKINRRKK